MSSPSVKINGRYTFPGEKLNDSPLFVQRLLTELGRRIERYTSVSTEKEGGGERKMIGAYKDYSEKVELYGDRIALLIGAERLCIRNGYDIAAIIHLVNKRKFKGIVQVSAAYVRDFIKVNLTRKKIDDISWEIEIGGNSQDDTYILNLPEIDRFGPEGMKPPHAPLSPQTILGKRKGSGQSSGTKKKAKGSAGKKKKRQLFIVSSSSSSDGDGTGYPYFEAGGDQPVRDDASDKDAEEHDYPDPPSNSDPEYPDDAVDVEDDDTLL